MSQTTVDTATPAATPQLAAPAFYLQEEPIRGELFSIEHLEEHARQIASTHAIAPGRPDRRLLGRFEENSRRLAIAYETISLAVQQNEPITPAAEWLLDNYYVIEEQLRTIRHDLPRRFYGQLPKLGEGVLAGHPRIYAIAAELIAHTDSALDEESLIRFVRAYQTVTPLTIGELWAVSIMLRVGLVENLRRLASQSLSARQERLRADQWLERSSDIGYRISDLEMRNQPKLTAPFVVQVAQRLRDQGGHAAQLMTWLETRLSEQGSSVDELTRLEHQRQAANQVSTGNSITSMRLLSSMDWPLYFERTSLVEEVLRQDPADIYGRMDFATRDRYRHAVEELARRSDFGFRIWDFGFNSEMAVARRVVDLARQRADDSKRGHIGYYLIDRGRHDLEAAIDYHPSFGQRIHRWVLNHPTPIYLGSIALVAALAVAALVLYAWVAGASWGILLLTGLLLLLPASDLAVSLVNYVITLAMQPRTLPKLELKDSIPADYRTVVAMPTMLFSTKGVRSLLERLEIHYLSNPELNLYFALLTDFADAPQKEMPEDDPLLAQAIAGVDELNARHGQDGGRFFLFHRTRRWNAAEGTWMGWERKRGKLLEFNRLLRGARDTTYSVTHGPLDELADIRYVITLDADTQLPRGAAKRLIGTIAHPLNQPRFDPECGRVVEGYGVVQPRVTVTLASAVRSRFAGIFSGPPGVDPYSVAVSDVYQDLFAEGNYVGKGIYDVDAFEAVVGSAFPENHILSHDLIEGCHARVALATDTELFDEFPPHYLAYARRQHRWIRGDWQILPWLSRRVPAGQVPSPQPSPAAGRGQGEGLGVGMQSPTPNPQPRSPNPLNAISRWKIFDNLRRSLTPVGLFTLLAVAWLTLPGAAWVWTVGSLVVLGFPIIAQIVSGLIARPFGTSVVRYLREVSIDVRLTVIQVFLAIVFLAHQAYVTMDAITRTLVRLYIKRRNLLEWETTSVAERRLENRLVTYWLHMWFAPVAAVGLAVAIGFKSVPTWWAAAPLLGLWLVSPAIAHALSRRRRVVTAPLNDQERLELRRIARKTWSYFERFVGPDDHWLPPDHYQEYPVPHSETRGGLRGVAHRLSATNEGLYLMSALAAHDFGYVAFHELATLLERNRETLEQLERYHGHFYNWYETRALRPLTPSYISTVDSGNLAACLVTLRHGLLELLHQPFLSDRLWAGLADTATLVQESIGRVHPPGARFVLPALDQVEEELRQLLDLIRQPPPSVAAWLAHLEKLEAHVAGLPELIGRFRSQIGVSAEELLHRVDRWLLQVRARIEDIKILAPWLASMTGLGLRCSSILSQSPPVSDKGKALWNRLQTALTGDLSLENLAGLAESSAADFEALEQALAGGQDAEHHEARDQLRLLQERVRSGALAASKLSRRYRQLADRYGTLVAEMDFSFLYDPHRRLFSVGYNAEAGRLDRAYYDMLASEARVASFLAIAKGDVETKHWFQLGRPMTQTASTRGLLSWGGTMFEYLMPLIVMRSYPDTILEQSHQAAVERQMEYGRLHRVPWGVSESSYSALDVNLLYHYQAFGVPGLGLKRGLARDVVVSPYSTALALMVRPREALANFRVLAREGADGTWGFYEAIDYSRDRLHAGQRCCLVRCYMAHHHGMTLAALANCLFSNCMQRRFHADPVVRATELLLQERVPRGAPLVQPHGDEVAAVYLVREAVRPVSRRFTTPDTPTPRTHLLSNGQYTVMLTNAGTGYSMCQGILLTRWRPDSTRDSWGQFIYVRDVRSGETWSAGYQPLRRRPDSYEVVYSVDKAEFRRRDGDIETHVEIAVSPENNAEIRQISLTNHGHQDRELEITSYAEIALTSFAADLAHPAFHKLFIETEFIAGRNALLAVRRPRDASQERLWAVHVLSMESQSGTEAAYGAFVQHESDRFRFLGRGRTPDQPDALRSRDRLSQTTGAVLDPIISLRAQIRVPAEQTARLSFSTAMAKSREEALALADQYHDSRAVTRTLELAWAHAQLELRHCHLLPGDTHLFQQLASALIYADPQRRAAGTVIAANDQAQPGLWRYGISGDLPILLVRLTEVEHMSLVRELLTAHEYLRSKGLVVDLIIFNDHPTSYINAVQEQLQELIRASNLRNLLDKPGGIYVLHGRRIPEADRILLHAVAMVVLHGDRGSLSRQLEQSAQDSVSLPPRIASHRKRGARDEKRGMRVVSSLAPRPSPLAPPGNGFGAFTSDGREYIIDLPPGQWTPAPWINVIANPNFGFLVSESGSGYTWSQNSRENKLTPWSNDPVSDPPGEALYVRDEETGQVWCPTLLPIGVRNQERMEDRESRFSIFDPLSSSSPGYRIAHGHGYTRFEHQANGIAHELLLSVAPSDPIKFACLKLRNDSNRPRRLSLTYYAEWVLGVTREQMQLHVFTEIDQETGALLARNAYNQDFARRIAFLDVVGRQRTVTGDRWEFVGRTGSLERPAALGRVELSNRVGAGLDPCGAVQTKVDLPPNGETEVIFLLGQAENINEAHSLLERYQHAEQVRAAIQQTQAFWNDLLTAVAVKTPDPAVDILVNRWLLYQVLSCRVWGRSAFYQSGGAYGYRDQLQDVMAILYSRPQLARDHILRAASRQFEQGDVQHWWHPPAGRGIRTRFSDDYLWLPFVTCHYLKVTGDQSILQERAGFLYSPSLEAHEQERYELPEVSQQIDTLYGHCIRAIDHSFRFGSHGLPLMGCGDWNDGMNKVGAGGQGESVWVGWFLATILDQFTPLVEARGDRDRAAYYRERAANLRQALEQAWDGQWYRRAYFDDGTPLGSAQSDECQIDSLAQSWSVLAGGDPQRARQAMRAVDERLVRRDEKLILLFTPPFDKSPQDPGYIKGYVPGVRENGGQYTHAALWVVQAFAMLGDGNRAMELFDLLNPIYHAENTDAALGYRVEPYVVAADIYGRPPHTGRGGWTWYTGSAAWMYRVALETLLGFQLRGDRLLINPCIPAQWNGFEITYRHGRATYHIVVENPEHVQCGVREVVCDGKVLDAKEIPLVIEGTHEVRIRM